MNIPMNWCRPAIHRPAYLREETYHGARTRFPLGIPANVQEQIEHELALIADLQYEPYFLTVYDIVRFARSQDILCQGRGSAANSAVCYCLRITEVDPARGNSLVERFMSRERNEPPDIDVDFEHQRREEVIQYIYDKYGRRRAALAAVVISYRPKSALRDSGRALGVDLAIVEKVAKAHRWFDGKRDLLNRLAESGLDPEAPLSQQWASAGAAAAGLSAPFVAAPGRLRDRAGQAVAPGADRKRHHGRPQRDRMGQGRSGGTGPDEGRRAGAGHAVGAAPRVRHWSACAAASRS